MDNTNTQIWDELLYERRISETVISVKYNLYACNTQYTHTVTGTLTTNRKFLSRFDETRILMKY